MPPHARLLAALTGIATVAQLVGMVCDLPHVPGVVGLALFVVGSVAVVTFVVGGGIRWVLRAVALSAALCLLLLVHHPPSDADPKTPPPQVVPPIRRPAMLASTAEPLTGIPRQVVQDDGRFWALAGTRTITAYDRDGISRFSLDVGHRVGSFAVCGTVVVATYAHGWVGTFSTITGERLGHYRFGRAAGKVLCSSTDIYVAKARTHSIVRLHRAGMRLATEIVVDGRLDDFTFADGALWVLDARAGVVRQVDPVSERVDERFSVMPGATSLDVVGGVVWVTHRAQRCMLAIDAAVRRERGPGVPFDGAPIDVARHGDVLYVTQTRGRVTAVDVGAPHPLRRELRFGRTRRLVASAAGGGVLFALDAGSRRGLATSSRGTTPSAHTLARLRRARPGCPAHDD